MFRSELLTLRVPALHTACDTSCSQAFARTLTQTRTGLVQCKPTHTHTVLTAVPVRAGDAAAFRRQDPASSRDIARLGHNPANSRNAPPTKTYRPQQQQHSSSAVTASDPKKPVDDATYEAFMSREDTEAGVVWSCRLCGLQVKTQSGLTRHVRQRHTDSPVYRCELCGMGFMSWSHYAGHMGAHSGVKNYECSRCSKRYFYMSDLARHRKKCEQSAVPPK